MTLKLWRAALAVTTALALALLPAAAATTATNPSLSATAFVDLGAGPMLLGGGPGGVVWVQADSLPSITLAGNVVQPGEPPACIGGTAHVWARATITAGTIAVVSAGTGVACGGSSGGGSGGAITGPLGSSTAPSAALSITDTGTPITGQTIPAGGQGLTGWISALYGAVVAPLSAQTGAVWIGNVGQNGSWSVALAAGSNTVGNVIAAPTASSSLAVSHSSVTSLGTSLVVKASAGNLYSYNCTAITGGAAGYCIAYNGTSAPGTGALTGANVLDVCYFAAGAGGCSLSHGRIPANYSTGIVVLVTSAATPFTYTTGTDTAYISADYN